MTHQSCEHKTSASVGSGVTAKERKEEADDDDDDDVHGTKAACGPFFSLFLVSEDDSWGSSGRVKAERGGVFGGEEK